jgi:hypothetical protein
MASGPDGLAGLSPPSELRLKTVPLAGLFRPTRLRLPSFTF